jgi:peptide/nickel transport system permease protein
MTRGRWLVRRALLSVVALWAVVSVTFAFVALTGDPNEALIRHAAAQEAASSGQNATEAINEALYAYREARNLNEPLLDRYLTWMRSVATLQLGISYRTGQPVVSLVARRLVVSLQYVVPGVGIALVGGVVVGTYAGLGGDDRLARLATGLSYAAYGVPNFWIASVVVSIAVWEFGILSLTGYDLDRGPWAVHNLTRLVLPAVLLGTGLIADIARYVRTEVLETRGEEFVKVARAKGAGRLRVARHVLRLAALPLASLVVSNLLGVLVVTVVVIEFVFDVPGFGLLMLGAIENRDLPTIVGVTLVVAATGIVGNFLKDVATTAFDPRVEE